MLMIGKSPKVFPFRSKVIGPAPISRELSSIGAGSALRYEILDGCEWLNGSLWMGIAA